jgi:hypothetical protein
MRTIFLTPPWEADVDTTSASAATTSQRNVYRLMRQIVETDRRPRSMRFMVVEVVCRSYKHRAMGIPQVAYTSIAASLLLAEVTVFLVLVGSGLSPFTSARDAIVRRRVR